MANLPETDNYPDLSDDVLNAISHTEDQTISLDQLLTRLSLPYSNTPVRVAIWNLIGRGLIEQDEKYHLKVV